jgi:hypothetical protein
MSQTNGATVLVVANRTASTPALLAEVHQRAATCRFGLLVPPVAESDWSADDALRLVGRAAGQEVTAVEPGPNAAATIHDLVEGGTYQEIILSTVPEHHHLWHRHGLTDRVQHLGVRVTVIPPEMDNWGPVAGFPDDWTPKAVNPAAVAGFGNY